MLKCKKLCLNYIVTNAAAVVAQVRVFLVITTVKWVRVVPKIFSLLYREKRYGKKTTPFSQWWALYSVKIIQVVLELKILKLLYSVEMKKRVLVLYLNKCSSSRRPGAGVSGYYHCEMGAGSSGNMFSF